tara:strand:+ start:1094 stop:2014 length:921 start_codon:yes stop_codon:yes gene_type:complete
MTTVPKVLERLQCCEIRHTFKARAEEMSHQLDLMEHNVAAVLDSKGIKELLTLAMATGNHVNDGSRRGQAHGFKLDAILKMKEIKSCDDKKYTLLHYMAETSSEDIKTYGNAFTLPGETFESLGAAARIQMSQLGEDFANLKLARSLLQREIKSKEHGAAFVNEMRPLLNNIINPMYLQLETRLNTLKIDANNLILRFGEQIKDTTIDVLFALLKNTLDCWEGCKIDLKTWKEQEIAAATKAAKKTKKKKSQKDMQSAVAAEMAKKLARRMVSQGSGLKNISQVSPKLHTHARHLSTQLNLKKMYK